MNKWANGYWAGADGYSGIGGIPMDKGHNTYRARLAEAIGKVERDKKIDFWEEVIKKALENPSIMVAVLKKYIPDMSSEEINHNFGDIYDILRERYLKGADSSPALPTGERPQIEGKDVQQ